MTMTSGILGQAGLTPATNAVLFSVEAGYFCTTNINLVNRSATTETKVRVAVIDGADPGSVADANYLEYDTVLYPNGMLERTGLVLDAGKSVVVRAETGEVSATAYGIVSEV